MAANKEDIFNAASELARSIMLGNARRDSRPAPVPQADAPVTRSKTPWIWIVSAIVLAVVLVLMKTRS